MIRCEEQQWETIEKIIWENNALGVTRIKRKHVKKTREKSRPFGVRHQNPFWCWAPNVSLTWAPSFWICLMMDVIS